MAMTTMKLLRNTNRILACICAGGMVLTSTSRAQDASTNTPTGPFPDQKDNVSYAIGVNIAGTIKGNLYELNNDVVINAMRDALTGQPLKLSDDQVRATLDFYRKEVGGLRQKARAAEAEARIAENKAWLEKNKTKEGVKTREVALANGAKSELQYKLIKEGNGDTPKATDFVTVNYRGTLINGQEFDSSARHGKPGRFGVGQVIRGWTEGLQLMKTGSKYEFYIPAELGYGQGGSPQSGIYPGATLIFEVELVGINLPEPAPETPASRPAATSDIIKVPSAEGLARGEKIEVIKAEDADRMVREAQAKAATNNPATNR
jgi:FKBP-type peptidyl-prolyl cis-trans isomerase